MAPIRKRRSTPRNPMGVPDAPASVERGIATGNVYARDPSGLESAWGDYYDPSDTFHAPEGFTTGMGIDESTGKYTGSPAQQAFRQQALAAGIIPADTPGVPTSAPAQTPVQAPASGGLTFLGDADVYLDESGNEIHPDDYHAILAEGNHDEEITTETWG